MYGSICLVFRREQFWATSFWTVANICPLYKKNDRSLPVNYRPVSLTCIVCKLLEHIVCFQVMGHLDSNHLIITDRQHAFRSKLSFFAKSRLFVDTLYSSYTNFLVRFYIYFALSVI